MRPPGPRRGRPAETDPERPVRAGRGPVVFSTCTELMLRSEAGGCYDVLGYYAALGVSWTAGKAELRRAYQALDGPSSRRLTHVLERLLDPAWRRHYDQARPGDQDTDPMLLDPEVAHAVRLEQAQLAAMLRMAAWGSNPGYSEEQHRQIRAEIGLEEVAPVRPVDGRLPDMQTGRTPPEFFEYGYYLWRSTSSDTAKLADWQSLLVGAARDRGLSARVAVGIKGRTPHTWVHALVGHLDVIFIDEDAEPTGEAATSAVELLSQLLDARAPQTP